MNVAEHYELALPLAQALGSRWEAAHIGLQTVHLIGGTLLTGCQIDEVGVGEPVEFGVILEEGELHEGNLGGAVVFAVSAHLLQRGILAYAQVGEVYDQLLPHTVGVVEASLVDGESKCAGGVLDNQGLVDVAGGVGGYDAALDDDVAAVILLAYRLVVVGVVLPVLGLEFRDSGVGLHCGLGFRDRRHVKVVLTGGQSGAGCESQERET